MSQTVKFDGMFSVGGKKVEFKSEAVMTLTSENLIDHTGRILAEAINKVVADMEEEAEDQPKQEVETQEQQEEPICTCENLDDDCCDRDDGCDECEDEGCDGPCRECGNYFCWDDKHKDEKSETKPEEEQAPQVIVQKVPADKVGALMKLLEEISKSAQ